MKFEKKKRAVLQVQEGSIIHTVTLENKDTFTITLKITIDVPGFKGVIDKVVMVSLV